MDKLKSVLIKNGHVVDPLQRIDEDVNLYIENGKIGMLTYETPAADEIIDAKGKIVCPGFIDIHMHEDEYDSDNHQLETGMAESALHMGVTLDIGGNCGDNSYDPEKILDYADCNGVPVNIGLLIGHTYLRNLKEPHNKYDSLNQDTIDQMTNSCKYFLDHGCLGVSFGLKYIPGTTKNEIMPLVRACKDGNKLVAAHVRQDVEGVFDATKELADMGKEGEVKVQFSHIGSMGGYGQMEELLNDIREYRKNGVDILCDCYPYNAFSTGIGETTYDEGFLERYQSDYDSILIVDGKYSGQRCTKEIFDELRENAPETGTVGYFMKAEDIERALLSPYVMIGSDGIRTSGKGHPRASGTFAKFIADYIATEKISLMEGVNKMTTMAASRLNLKNKGNFLPGSDADIVIFDLANVKDCSTYENGEIPSKGFDYVLINGEIALKDDKIINNRLGKAVRG